MKKLLFIDDQVELLSVFKKFFSKLDFAVLTAPDGRTGLALAKSDKPDLIVLDIRMPILDGIETLKKLRKKDKTTRVVMLTGYGTADYLRMTSELDVSDFISKPFDLHALLEVIRGVLGDS